MGKDAANAEEDRRAAILGAEPASSAGVQLEAGADQHQALDKGEPGHENMVVA